MRRFLSAHAAKLLLVLALAWAGASAWLNPARPAGLPDEERLAVSQVQVVWVPCGKEEGKHIWAEPPSKLELDIPEPGPRPLALSLPPVTRAPLRAAPPLLTSPGPTLEGADRIPGPGVRVQGFEFRAGAGNPKR